MTVHSTSLTLPHFTTRAHTRAHRSCLYEHHPRPKDFLLEHHIPALLRSLLGAGGRGTDAVHQEAQRLLTAFQINVLF